MAEIVESEKTKRKVDQNTYKMKSLRNNHRAIIKHRTQRVRRCIHFLADLLPVALFFPDFLPAFLVPFLAPALDLLPTEALAGEADPPAAAAAGAALLMDFDLVALLAPVFLLDDLFATFPLAKHIIRITESKNPKI